MPYDANIILYANKYKYTQYLHIAFCAKIYLCTLCGYVCKKQPAKICTIYPLNVRKLLNKGKEQRLS